MATKPSIPAVYVSFIDGALGISSGTPDNQEAKLGTCTLGTPLQLYSFTTVQQVKDTLGGGPLAEACAFAVAQTGLTFAMPVTASTAGTVGAVTKVAGSTGTGTVTVAATSAGSINDAYEAQIKLTKTGLNIAANTAAFVYSLDGGDNWSAETAVPTGGTFAIPGTGLTITFVNGGSGTSFQPGDLHTFNSVAPAMTLADLQTAINALFATPALFAGMHVVGISTPTIAAGVGVKMDDAENANRFMYAVLEARDIDATTDSGSEATWMTNLKTEWANVAHNRLSVCAGGVELTSQLTGRSYRRNLAWAYTARLMSIAPHKHPGEVIEGPVSGVTKLYHNEEGTPGLDSGRFVTMRTIVGQAGFFITRGRMMAPLTSDVQSIQHRRVLDKGGTVARNAAIRYMNADVSLDPATGYILESEAVAIDSYVTGILETELVDTKNVSAVSYRINRSDNLLSTSATKGQVRVLPKGYLEWLGLDVGFTNPKLQAS